jgi:hypothetical protein
MWNRKRKPIGRGGLTAFIDEDSEIEGRFCFKGTLMLNGHFKGGHLVLGHAHHWREG